MYGTCWDWADARRRNLPAGAQPAPQRCNKRRSRECHYALFTVQGLTLPSLPLYNRLMMTASFCLLVAQLSSVLAAPAPDQESKFKIDDFAMYVQGAMNADILTDISSNETSHIVEHPHWTGRPVSVGVPTRNGFLRVRLESDFLVIWLRRTKAASAQHNDLGAVVKQATATLLRQSFVIDEFAVKSGPRLIGRPQKVVGTDIDLPPRTGTDSE